MAVMNPLYTGRDSAVKMPELDALTQAQRRASDLTIKGEEMKLNKFMQDKERFRKMLAIDPVLAVSQQNQVRQASDIKAYNDKWAKKYAETDGNLSDLDEIEMQQDRGLLQAKQNKILTDQKKYEAAKDIVTRDTRGYYDRDLFRKAEQTYFETGELPTTLLDVAPQSITNYLRKLPPTAEETSTERRPVLDAKGNTVGERLVDVSYNRTKEQAQSAILEAMQNEAMLKTVVRDFDALPEKEQLKWLEDYNKDGVVDPQDKQYAYENTNIADNPIAKWAMNNPIYLDEARGKKEGVSKAIPSVGAKGKGGLSINFSGQNLQVSPGYKRSGTQAYGDKVYYNTYAFPSKITLPNVSTEGGIVFEEDYSSELGSGNIQGIIKDYVKDNDMVIIEATKGYPDFNISTGGLVAIPAGNIQDIDKLPIKDENGNSVTIGAIRGQKPAQVVKKKAY